MAAAAASDRFADLYRRNGPSVLRYLRSQALSWDQAEDLAAETFLRAWARWDAYQDRGLPELHWLLRIARNLVIDSARRKQMPVAVGADPPTTDSTSQSVVARSALEQALAMLSVEAREIVGLRAAGLAFTEIGVMTGRTDVAARMAWHRAAKRVRAAMEERDG